MSSLLEGRKGKRLAENMEIEYAVIYAEDTSKVKFRGIFSSAVRISEIWS